MTGNVIPGVTNLLAVYAATTGAGANVYQLDPGTLQPDSPAATDPNVPDALALSTDGNTLFVASTDGSVAVYSTYVKNSGPALNLTQTITGLTDPTALAETVTPDGTQLLLVTEGSGNAVVPITFDTATQRWVVQGPDLNNPGTGGALTPASPLLLHQPIEKTRSNT